MCSEIMLTGTATFTRGSTAARRNVCVPPPDSPVAASASRRTYGQRLEKVERADAVPQLQPGEAQPPERFAAAAERVRQLLAVVVADHVVAEDDEALAREPDRASPVRT